MNGNFRGGNSRLLAKQLDETSWPIALLDGHGEIVFINKELCRVAGADSSELVGRACCWQIPGDEVAYGYLLHALAPPRCVLEGRCVVRELDWPPKSPKWKIDQLFIPFPGSADASRSCLVVFGIGTPMLHASISPLSALPANAAEFLIRLRGQWSQLDGLQALCGKSSAAQIAMQRSQLAMNSECGVFLWGPNGVGKADVARGIYCGRMRQRAIASTSNQFFPLDCSVLDTALAEGMLEVFLSRMTPENDRAVHQLALERMDELPEDCVSVFSDWLARFDSRCSVFATSRVTPVELEQRGEKWRELLLRTNTLEIHLPALSQRSEDIPVLLEHSLASAAHRSNRVPPQISQAAGDLLTAYAWPGNLAELNRTVQEFLPRVMPGTSVLPNHLPLALRTFSSSRGSGDHAMQPINLDETLVELERIIISRALKLSPRNRAQAARSLGISRPRLLRRIVELGLDAQSPPTSE